MVPRLREFQASLDRSAKHREDQNSPYLSLAPLSRLRVQDGDVGNVVVDGLVAADDHEVRLVDLGGAEVEEQARHLPVAHDLPVVAARVLLLDDVGPPVPVVVAAENHHFAVEDAAGAVLPRVVCGPGLKEKQRLQLQASVRGRVLSHVGPVLVAEGEAEAGVVNVDVGAAALVDLAVDVLGGAALDLALRRVRQRLRRVARVAVGLRGRELEADAALRKASLNPGKISVSTVSTWYPLMARATPSVGRSWAEAAAIRRTKVATIFIMT